MNDEYAVDGYNTAGTVTEGGLPFAQMGTSFVIGLALGYFLKKSFKILLLLLGLGLVVLFIGDTQGWIQLDGKMLENGVSEGVNAFQSFGGKLQVWLSELDLSNKASAIAGFAAGLKFG